MEGKAELERRDVPFPAQSFIDDPLLFERIEKAWRDQNWLALFGEMPVGAVLATLDDGITFHYKRWVHSATPSPKPSQ